VAKILRHPVPGFDESLRARLPALRPQQGIGSFGQLAHPLLVAIDPALC
jgi:hypothetical protein